MSRSLLKSVSYEELAQMRDNGMTNKDIATSLGVSPQTVYKYLGPQPSRGWSRHAYNDRPLSNPEQPNKDEPDDAALIIENRTINLAGLFAGYKIDIKAKEIRVFVEDGVDALVIPFDQVVNFAKELRAITKHVKDLSVGAEAW